MINPRRFAKMGATLFGTVVLVGGVIATIAGLGMADVKKTHTAAIEDRATEKGEVSVSNADAMSAAAARLRSPRPRCRTFRRCLRPKHHPC